MTNATRGVLLKIAATFVFTIMSSLVKLVGDVVPTGQIVFCRSFFAFLPLMVFLAWRGELSTAWKATKLSSHVVRAVFGVTSMFLGFAALAFIPLTDQIAIGYAMPIFAVVFAALVLKETVRAYRWTAVLVGFVGVGVILWPHVGALAERSLASGATLGALLALAAAVVSALATITVRQLTKTETLGSIVFYFTLLSTLIGLATLPLGWIWPTPLQAVILVTIGLLGGLGQILHTNSYRHGDASLIATFEYCSLLWAVLFGFVLFGDIPTWSVLVGAGIIVASGLFVIWRERRLGLERRPEREAGKPGT